MTEIITLEFVVGLNVGLGLGFAAGIFFWRRFLKKCERDKWKAEYNDNRFGG